MTTEEVMEIAGIVLKAALDTPAGKQLVQTIEDAAIREAPGAAGVLIRTLAAMAPHDVVSAGFRKDGPG